MPEPPKPPKISADEARLAAALISNTNPEFLKMVQKIASSKLHLMEAVQELHGIPTACGTSGAYVSVDPSSGADIYLSRVGVKVELGPDLMEALKEKRKINGIKIIRDQCFLGLKEAKELYEEIEEAYNNGTLKLGATTKLVGAMEAVMTDLLDGWLS